LGKKARLKKTRDVPKPRTTSGSGRGNREWLIWVGLGVVIAAAAVAAFLITQRGNGDSTSMPTAETVQVEGNPLPAFSGDADDPAVGMAAPGLTGTNLDGGGSMTIPAGQGKPRLVIFLAHWCPHCRREVPLIADWLNQNGMPTNVDLYSVATANSPDLPNYPPSTWLADAGWEPPVMLDDSSQTAAQAYGLQSYPYFVFVGADGKVVKRLTGEIPVSELGSELDSLGGSAG
jgi:thiol-disulfide isomerase/thioredoxin